VDGAHETPMSMRRWRDHNDALSHCPIAIQDARHQLLLSRSVHHEMDLTQLRTFVAVAQEGHLTRAAERLHISQPAASAHIRALESFFELQLFTRTNRGLELTVAGQRLAEGAGRVLGSTLELTSLARELRGGKVGRL